MKLFNSYTNKMEEFVPIEEGKVKMYVCGPTVYNHPHIGNGRPIIVYDTLKKTFEALGYDVTYVSNFTDVDDKIIKKAIEEITGKPALNDLKSLKQAKAELKEFTSTAKESAEEVEDAVIESDNVIVNDTQI